MPPIARSRPMKRIALLLASAACASGPQPAAKTVAAASPRAIADAPDRTEADRQLDPGRHPVQMLEFLALKPGMKVLDLGAGGGYTTELIARAVAPAPPGAARAGVGWPAAPSRARRRGPARAARPSPGGGRRWRAPPPRAGRRRPGGGGDLGLGLRDSRESPSLPRPACGPGA